jgi:WhiB family redox-sensing transcriptional regulator
MALLFSPTQLEVDEVNSTTNWTDAKCATGDARLLHLFFSEIPHEIEEAKAICSSCPLRLTCLEQAVERSEPWGVWGAQLFDHGRVIAEKRGRGRPSKAEIERQRALEEELSLAVEVA